jgi:hypothetical protein
MPSARYEVVFILPLDANLALVDGERVAIESNRHASSRSRETP